MLVDGRAVAHLGRDAFVGEVGVLGDGIRTATVEAETRLRCLILPHSGLEALLVDHPRLGVNLLREVLTRFRTLSNTASAGRGGSGPDR